ncbi:MAG TPA: S49 family peptidase, partial [Gemmatales bacterium]|nr:S49 family peptidase [Gemmatales bacterium]
KAAGEPFSRSNMSEANRKQWEKLADDYYEIVAETLAKSRPGFDIAKAKAAIDEGMYTSQAAVHARLVDKIAYADELVTDIKKNLSDDKLLVRKDYGKSKEELDLSNPFALLKQLKREKAASVSLAKPWALPPWWN